MTNLELYQHQRWQKMNNSLSSKKNLNPVTLSHRSHCQIYMNFHTCQAYIRSHTCDIYIRSYTCYECIISYKYKANFCFYKLLCKFEHPAPPASTVYTTTLEPPATQAPMTFPAPPALLLTPAPQAPLFTPCLSYFLNQE